MKVAITGGSGFVGKELVKYHADKHDQVKVLSRNPNIYSEWPNEVELFKADLTTCISSDLNDFVKEVDVLYHCAGELYDTNLMEDLHIKGTQKLIESSRSSKVDRWVQLSSVGAYGPFPGVFVDEDYPCQPKGIYEITKAESDNLVLEAAKKRSFNCFILRPSIIFGPKMINNSLFEMIRMIDKRLFFFIGKSGSYANYIHIENVIEALILCGRCKPKKNFEVYNLSDSLTFEEFVSVISRKLVRSQPKFRIPKWPLLIISTIINSMMRFPLTVNRINSLSDRTLYDSDKIKTELGYEQKISLNDGLLQMVDEYFKKK